MRLLLADASLVLEEAAVDVETESSIVSTGVHDTSSAKNIDVIILLFIFSEMKFHYHFYAEINLSLKHLADL